MESNTTNMKFAACEQPATLRKSCITHKPKANEILNMPQK
jgi:hypothetical protein